jgi:Bacterial PH domain
MAAGSHGSRDGQPESFPLAPMTGDLLVQTSLLLPLPVVLAAAGVFGPAKVSPALFGSAVFSAALYVAIWLVGRPSRFEVSETGVRIVWPVREREIFSTEITSVSLVSGADFRKEHGRGTRVGAGGLWGAFGSLATNRLTFSMYISRTDRFVVVRLASDPPLLITPAGPQRFVAALDRVRARPR